MKLVPINYLMSEGADTPDNCIVKECKICNRKFAVPVSELGSETEICCADCETAYNQQLAQQSINDMKYEHSSEKDAIDAALGQ